MHLNIHFGETIYVKIYFYSFLVMICCWFLDDHGFMRLAEQVYNQSSTDYLLTDFCSMPVPLHWLQQYHVCAVGMPSGACGSSFSLSCTSVLTTGTSPLHPPLPQCFVSQWSSIRYSYIVQNAARQPNPADLFRAVKKCSPGGWRHYQCIVRITLTVSTDDLWDPVGGV